jgi:hypothetical protein
VAAGANDFDIYNVVAMSKSAASAAGGWLKKLLPGAALLVRYERSLLRHDALAGLVVALVLIPSAFAYADLAKCAPAAGIYAAVGGMVVFAMFTSSRHVIVGPDAAIALLVGGDDRTACSRRCRQGGDTGYRARVSDGWRAVANGAIATRRRCGFPFQPRNAWVHERRCGRDCWQPDRKTMWHQTH